VGAGEDDRRRLVLVPLLVGLWRIRRAEIS
jgi:hypothetical protein